MRIIKVGGTEERLELAQAIQAGIEGAWMFSLERGDETEAPASGEQIEHWLSESGMFGQDDVVVLETNEPFEGLHTIFQVYVSDKPVDQLDPYLQPATSGIDLMLVHWTAAFDGTDELGLEGAMKERTGASKVLVFRTDEERERAFGKARDMAAAQSGGGAMAEEFPPRLTEAVRQSAEDGRISCERAHELARELDVSLETVGRALDLEKIKIKKCQLGCF